MSTISGLTSSISYPYTGTAAAAAIPSSTTAPSVILSQQNSASPLTYNAAGLFNATGQTGNAQSTLLAVQSAIAQTQNSLLTGNASNSASSDLFNATSSPLGSYTPQATGNTIQTAQNAYFAAEEAVNQAFSSIA